MRIKVWDPSRKVDHLGKVIWNRKIITEFSRSISSTRVGKPVLMMVVKISKDKNISKWVDQENLTYVRWNRIKNRTQSWRMWSIEEKRSKTLSEVKPVENISKNLQSFLEISPVQKSTLCISWTEPISFFHINAFRGDANPWPDFSKCCWKKENKTISDQIFWSFKK